MRYFPSCTSKQMLPTSAKSANICLGTHKNPRIQTPACFLGNSHMVHHTLHLHWGECTSGMLQWHPCSKSESKQTQTKIYSQWCFYSMPKKWHFLKQACRHLWVSHVLDNSETVFQFLCQLNTFGWGKGIFCKIEAKKTINIFYIWLMLKAIHCVVYACVC